MKNFKSFVAEEKPNIKLKAKGEQDFVDAHKVEITDPTDQGNNSAKVTTKANSGKHKNDRADNKQEFGEAVKKTYQVSGKVLAAKMRQIPSLKSFADKFENKPIVTPQMVDKMLPDYISGGEITKLFKESVEESVKPDVEKAFPASGVRKHTAPKGTSTMPKDKEKAKGKPAGSFKEEVKELDEVSLKLGLKAYKGRMASMDDEENSSGDPDKAMKNYYPDKDGPYGERKSDRTAKRIIKKHGIKGKKAIDKMKMFSEQNKPFFMAVGYVSPHLPFIQPKKYWDMYNHDAIQLADNVYQPKNSPDIAIEAQHNSAEMRKNYLDMPENGPLSDELSRNLIHGYYASITYMDALIGELLKSLDELGIRDNTTIVLWSDHGYFLGEHGFWCKHSTFYEAVKIPLYISAPNYAKNKTTNSFTELVDIYPTLCDIAGITPPKHLQGESVVSVLKDPTKQLKSEVYTRYKQGEAVIDKNFSYTEFYEGEKYLGNMLYDMNKDMKQNTDISKIEANKELVEKYKKKLKIMRDKVSKNPI